MDEPLPRILLLAGRYALRGTWSYTLRLAEHLPEHGFSTTVICPDARRVDPVRRQELHIQQYPLIQTPLWGQVVLAMLYRQLEKQPPHLIHIQSRSAVKAGLWLARRLNVPYIQSVHDFLQTRQRFVCDRRLCRKIIAVSEAVRSDLLGKAGLPSELVTVVPPGVECGESVAGPVLQPGRVPVIGTAGPLESIKGMPFFLGAAALVLQSQRDVEFLIAGAGPEEINLRRLARELGINDHVTFVPNLLDFDEALLAMDVFCLPSLQQGIGTIMLEAMALGRPVIATRVGGVYRIIRDNETGLLVPPSDSRRLGERILELLDLPARSRAIGAAGQREVEDRYSVQQMIRQTVELYREILNVSSPAAV
jgi:glycosyltransferase involved in cell wall biosynthesis